MSSIAEPIVCGGCSKKFAWKVELAGKRVRCKCGHTIIVNFGPAKPASAKPGPVKPVVEKSATTGPIPLKPLPVKRVAPKPVKPVEEDPLDGLFALADDADRAAAAAPIEVREVAPVVAARSAKLRPPGHPARLSQRSFRDRKT